MSYLCCFGKKERMTRTPTQATDTSLFVRLFSSRKSKRDWETRSLRAKWMEGVLAETGQKRFNPERASLRPGRGAASRTQSSRMNVIRRVRHRLSTFIRRSSSFSGQRSAHSGRRSSKNSLNNSFGFLEMEAQRFENEFMEVSGSKPKRSSQRTAEGRLTAKEQAEFQRSLDKNPEIIDGVVDV